MNIFQNLDLFTVGVIIASTGILGFIVFFNNPKSITNKTFLVFCLLTIVWGSLNYLSYQIHLLDLAFWLLRLSIFFAVWHSFFLFQLLYVFPKEQFDFPKIYQSGLVPLVLFAALINLTPLTFSHVSQTSPNGQITQVANGPGIVFFSMIIFGLIIGGVIYFWKKLKAGRDIGLKQGVPVIMGITITFACILLFNFIFPAFLNNSRYIALGALFFFPFIVGISYSIFKYQLLSLKVVSTEILTFVLAIVILLEAVSSNSVSALLYQTSIFLLVVCLGILLIKSVMKEIEQRRQLEILTKQLGEANEQLKALDKARSEFITIASHQLRTPPATIKWYLAALLNGDYGKFKKDQLEILTKTNRTNNSLIGLIDDMLNVSRIERGKMEFLFEPANLSDLLSITYEQLLPISIEKHLKMTLSLPKKKLPQLMADKEKIRQVMNNLIDNAIKYTKEGTVGVKLETDDKEIRFSVKDSGKGITAEEQGSIFEKFSRGKESIKQSAGLGLGLYVAKIVIEQHKGKIWAESEGAGKGSTFIFTLPINSGLSQTTLVDLTKNQ